ncbi:site-specific DNA-methyltransferase [Bacillus velezensis]|uniref:site-specific DNA-methyltransferase n=1 Tax=Bacillus velezensis TaxID=492670 RepID=UPI0015F06D3A|nr:site-specific DNA-methyltransferase [Bacillus velezensis]QMI88335.1 site-specific DNA-methyltransferase [Bacillus velezensis]WJM64478.1 site-specific DNA-methyltransferase [Bacillus velezensis]
MENEKFINRVLHGDCLTEWLPKIESGTIDLVVTDPPYNIGIDSWDKIGGYLEWMGLIFKEIERVLKPNGSFYWFHNDFEKIVDLQNWIKKNTDFKFKQLIVWDKYNGSKWNQLNAVVHSNKNRNYSKQAEYCLFYTFQGEVNARTVKDEYVSKNNPFKNELHRARKLEGLTITQVAERGKFYGKVNHGGKVTNWEKGYNIPTYEQWEKLKTYLPINKEYDVLKKEYKKLKYTFNNRGLSSIWQHEPVSIKGHSTPKPVKILENIILHSSNEGDTVLDCFGGSGSTAIACLNTNRNYILMEKELKYCDLTNKRIRETIKREGACIR